MNEYLIPTFVGQRGCFRWLKRNVFEAGQQGKYDTIARYKTNEATNNNTLC